MESEVRKRKSSSNEKETVKESLENSQKISDEDIVKQYSLPLHILPLILICFSLLCVGFSKAFPSHHISILILSHLGTALNNFGLCQALYAVVLDAGSTGSRVLTFSFYRNPFTGLLVLEEENFHEVKPGLSSYATNPEAGADSISSLLSLAQNKVPKEKWSEVPVTLRATAGLRLIPSDQSTALLNAVEQRLVKAGLDSRGVGMLSELDEGLFGWLTVNYLMEQLPQPKKSYVALDLGGGSTQITFQPKYEETLASSPASHLHQVKVSGGTQTLYSHSYLGLGLMAARKAIFSWNNRENTTQLMSPCMVLDLVPWEYQGRHYTISSSRTLPGYEACMLAVQAVIDKLGVDQCKEVPTRKIAAFSYFHDRAVDAGMLAPGSSGVLTVQQFLDSAKTACTTSTPDQPFLCVDLTYIAGLLHHGYRLDPTALLGLYKQIGGFQTSWALGAAFNMLE